MWGHRFWAARFWGPRYWSPAVGAPVASPNLPPYIVVYMWKRTA